MLRELRTLLAVARSGTLTAAGTQLGLTQSAVSAQMQRLEGLLNQPLFDRTGRSAILNEAGRAVLPLAEQMLGLEEQLLSGGASAGVGSLRVGAVATAQKGLLARAIAAFRAIQAEIRVRVVPGVSLELLGKVDAAEIDLAVMIRPPFAIPAELRWQPLLQEPYVLVVPSRWAGQGWREALAAAPFIRYDRASFGGRQVERFLHKHRIAVHDAIELDDPEAAVGLVSQGLGVALLPAIGVVSDPLELPTGIKVIHLGEAEFFREIGALTRAKLPVGSPAEQLLACLCEQATPGGE